MYKRARKEVPGQDLGASTLASPHVEVRAILENPSRKVSMLKTLLRCYVDIMKDEIALSTLYDMIDHCT
jgi:hypothetical protein